MTPEKKQSTSVRLPERHMATLKRAADADGRTVSNLVRLIVIQYLDRREGAVAGVTDND